MGNCCGNEEEQKPLLPEGNVGARSGTLSEPPPVVTEPPQSARQHRPTEHKEFETSIELISTVQLKTLPIAALDKQFKDLATIYNEVVQNFRTLESETHKFKEYFVAETAGIPVLAACVKLLVKRAGGSTIKVERKSKHFIELSYDTKEIAVCCQGNQENTIKPLEHFSNACRNINIILSHAPLVEHNVQIILQDQEKLNRDILKEDLPNSELQEALKAFLENVSKLRVMRAGSDTIKRDVEKKFAEYSKASKGFFDENES